MRGAVASPGECATWRARCANARRLMREARRTPTAAGPPSTSPGRHERLTLVTAQGAQAAPAVMSPGGPLPATPSTMSASATQWETILSRINESTVAIPPDRAFNHHKASASADPADPTRHGQQVPCVLLIMPGAFQLPEQYKSLVLVIKDQLSKLNDGPPGVSAGPDQRLDVWVVVAGCEPIAVRNCLATLIKEETATMPPADPSTNAASKLESSDHNPDSTVSQAAAAGTALKAATTSVEETVEVPTSETLQQDVFHHVLLACDQLGVPLHQSASGRFTNVVVVNHSLAGCLFSDAAYAKTGGVILLSSSWAQRTNTSITQSGWAASTRPMMVIGGQDDGQLAWPTYLNDAAVSAWTALRQGAAYAATHKPVILVPGLNHGQVCGQPAMLERGDCEAGAPEAITLGAVGKAVAAFLYTHFAHKPPGQESHNCASDYLLEQAISTASYLEAYAIATGMGSLVAWWSEARALDCLEKPGGPATSPVATINASQVKDDTVADAVVGRPGRNLYTNAARSVAHLLTKAADSLTSTAKQALSHSASHNLNQQAVSQPVIISRNVGVRLASGRVFGAAPASLASPLDHTASVGAVGHGTTVVPTGLAEATEQEVTDFQMLVVDSAVRGGLLPPELSDKLRVVVHVHNNLNSFIYSQSVMRKVTGRNMTELQVHAFPHWPALDKGPDDLYGWYCFSHSLWVKLKSEMGVAAEMRELLGHTALPASDYSKAPRLTGRDMNDSALQWALAAVQGEVRDRYERQGVPLLLDQDQPVQLAPRWVINSRMRFSLSNFKDHTTSGNTQAGVTASSPDRTVHVSSPVFSQAQLPPTLKPDELLLPPSDEESRRFWAPLYAKVMSRAQAVEWVQLGSLRHRTLPEAAGCRWGGHEVP